MRQLMTLIAAFCFFTAAGVAQGAPVAVVPVDTYEFPPVPEGTKVVHEFKIQNQGTETLHIEDVKTG